MKTVNRCNSDCIYCFTDKSRKLRKVNLSFLKNLFSKAGRYLKLNHDETIEIQWHGGEPLLLGIDFYRNVLKTQTAYCAECSHRIIHSFQSNLTLLTESFLQVLTALNLKNIGTSIDPDNSVRLLKKPGDRHAYKNKLFAALMLLEKKNINVGINYVVTKKSLDLPEDVFYYLTNINLNGPVSVNPVMIRDAALEDLNITPEDFKEFLQQTFPLWWQIKDRISTVEPYSSLADTARSLLNNNLSGDIRQEIPVVIDTEGDYRHYKKPGMPLGNLFNETMEEMVHKTNQYHHQLLNDISKVRNCNSCSLWSSCFGNTIMDAFSQNDELLDDNWCHARISMVKDFLINFLNEKNEAA
ncbi:MAG: radical SAM protein [Bacteroidales bacterium]|nr:radical SAM protein [Bacteroidales bacterium]